MITFKSLTIKNFLSIGNGPQTIVFDEHELVLVLGENLDLGGNDNRNGSGKTTIIQSLSFALFGSALTKIRKDNLINANNQKNMLVTLVFEIDQQTYKIIRGRKPNIFKFFKNDKEQEESVNETDSNESLGENRHTQAEIERLLGFNHDLFSHLVALNTYTDPFLALRSNDQRMIIEQLLGITKLSEKAEKLKEEIKIVKDKIKEEEFRITAATEANKRIEQNILNLQSKSSSWDTLKEQKIEKLQTSILELLNVDINAEIELHKSKKEVAELKTECKSLTKELAGLKNDINEHTNTIARLDLIIPTFSKKICPTCNGEMDKDTHEKVHNDYISQYNIAKQKLQDKSLKRDELTELFNTVTSMIPTLANTFYNTIDEAYNHKTKLDTLGNSLTLELNLINPFTEQIESLKKHGLQNIDFTSLNAFVVLKDHQEFLLKLLTNKDSFIRKKIIDQNLTFLNHRLSHYLIGIGLPHSITFKSDLEVEITMYGREYDFDNLSRGERTRLILALSWSFRDVFESMNSKINLLFVDELIDSGLDTSGVEASLVILKKMGREGSRNIFLISHREELTSRVSTVLKVVKENGFTTVASNT